MIDTELYAIAIEDSSDDTITEYILAIESFCNEIYKDFMYESAALEAEGDDDPSQEDLDKLMQKAMKLKAKAKSAKSTADAIEFTQQYNSLMKEVYQCEKYADKDKKRRVKKILKVIIGSVLGIAAAFGLAFTLNKLKASWIDKQENTVSPEVKAECDKILSDLKKELASKYYPRGSGKKLNIKPGSRFKVVDAKDLDPYERPGKFYLDAASDKFIAKHSEELDTIHAAMYDKLMDAPRGGKRVDVLFDIDRKANRQYRDDTYEKLRQIYNKSVDRHYTKHGYLAPPRNPRDAKVMIEK